MEINVRINRAKLLKVGMSGIENAGTGLADLERIV